MFYKFPMPSKHNGVGLYAMPNQQLGIEVGRPRDVAMAYDHELAKGRAVTIRVDGHDDLPSGTGIARSKSQMKPRGSANINDQDPDDNDTYADPQEVAAKVISYLKDLISPEDLEAVNGLLMGAESDDAHEGRLDAADRAIDRRRMARLAADAARQRPMTAAENAEFDRLFPTAKLILHR